MRRLLKWLLVLGILGGAGVGVYAPLMAYWKTRTAPKFREADVTRGEIISVVNATGTVNPVLSIRVGSFASGPVAKLRVDYNTRVKKDELLAKIDPRVYEAVKSRDEAALAVANAEKDRVLETLKQAIADEERAQRLSKKSKDYISEAELDKLRFARTALQAQIKVTEAQVKQAAANLENAMANLGYTEIRSPVDGVIIDRKIDEGQTLVAQFQTPDLFVVAPDLEKEIYAYAAVDEADIGLIREAQDHKQPVYFTVDAYPDDLFTGCIAQIRMNPASKENVVTYQVVVSTPNPFLKLMPGMTAKLSFQIEKREGVVKIPNAALRFYPSKVQYVRPEDRKLIEGTEEETTEADSGDKTTDARSAVQRILAHRQSNRRHVWVVDGEFLRAVEVVIGLSDYKFTELVSGDLKEGDHLVTHVK